MAAGVAAISAISGVVDAGSNSPWPKDAVVASAYPAAVYQPSDDIDGAGDRRLRTDLPHRGRRRDPGADHGDRSVRPLVPPAVGHVGSAGRGRNTGSGPSTPTSSTITFGPGTGIVIADDATMDLYELGPADRAELERTGALLLQLGLLAVVRAGPSTGLEGRVETEHGALTFPLAVRASVAAAMLAAGGARRCRRPTRRSAPTR